MARPQKRTVDYFPHSAISGKTVFKLESAWGNDGYAFWFKLLELLCQSDGHLFDFNQEKDFLCAKARVSEDTAVSILSKLAEWGNIDPELWAQGRVWCQNLVNGLRDAYRRRPDLYPERPVNDGKNQLKRGLLTEESQINDDNDGKNLERERERESKEKDERRESACAAILFLNEKTGKKFTTCDANIRPIMARLAEGHSIEDVMRVIEIKTADWKNDPAMNKYLCPDTLFRPSNFEKYLNQQTVDARASPNDQPTWGSVMAKLEQEGVV